MFPYENTQKRWRARKTPLEQTIQWRRCPEIADFSESLSLVMVETSDQLALVRLFLALSVLGSWRVLRAFLCVHVLRFPEQGSLRGGPIPVSGTEGFGAPTKHHSRFPGGECTTPSYSQSLANFLSQTPLRKEFLHWIRKFLPCHLQSHSHSLANSFATPNSQLFM